MNHVTARLWNDEAGFVVSIELILISTIAVLGLITGMTAVRDSVVSELADVAGAIQELNQSYSFFGVVGHSASTSGSDYIDMTDWCDEPGDPDGLADSCITFDGGPDDEGAGGP